MKASYLLRLSVNDSKSRLSRKLLLVLGVAIGVAVVVAVDLANDSVSRSFHLSAASISGKATHQIIGSEEGLPQKLYIRLRQSTQKIAPVISGSVKAEQLGNRTLRLLGIDPFVDYQFRAYLGNVGDSESQFLMSTLMTEPGAVLITRDLAEQFQLELGDSIDLQSKNGLIRAKISGMTQGDNPFTNQALSGIILADISVAQEILGMGDRLSSIDLIVDPEDKEVLEKIGSQLPDGTRLIELEHNRESTRQMSSAFELNLRALSLLALFVGMFLIYNTVSFSVVQRRYQLGTFRALGMTRKEIFSLILTETFIWGLIGTLFGLLLGIILGTGMVRLVSRTISDLYFVLTVNVFHLNPVQLLKALSLGILASIISALTPAREAANINPIEALRRSSIEKKTVTRLAGVTLAGTCMILIGTALIWIPSRNLPLAFLALFIFVCGAALIVPWLTSKFTQLLSILLAPFTRVTTRIAIRNISRSLSRTGVSIASLMVAISVIVGVDTMVGSFRASVVNWLSQTIQADIYVTSANSFSPLDPNIMSSLRLVPGVEQLFSIQRKHIRHGPYANSELLSVNKDTTERDWMWVAADESKIEQLFQEGWVFVSETFAWKYQIEEKPDQVLELDTDHGIRQFRLGGIFRDFTTDQGIIVLHEDTYNRYWVDRSLFGVSLFVSESAEVDQVIKDIESQLGSTYDLMINSNQALRNSAIEVFDRTFTITVALRILASLVAFLGVLNTVMSLMIEREKEIGILRANGLTKGQLWKLSLTESGISGFLAGLFALPLGTALAWILVVIINKRSFGWTLEFAPQPGSYLLALLLSVSAAVLASVYPVIATNRKQIAGTLRME